MLPTLLVSGCAIAVVGLYVITCRAAFSACVKLHNDFRRLAGLLAVMLRCSIKGLEPDVITCNALISACEKGHKRELPDVTSYSTAVGACDRGHRWQQDLGLLEAKQPNAVLLDVTSHTATVNACEKGQQW